jgi:uncharacterized protein (DUF2267 family)
MSVTGLAVFDSTIHKTNIWLKDLMQALGWQDRHKAYKALRITIHALRDRLTVEETAQFAAQLPLLIRGLYYEGWDPTGKPLKERHREQFLAHIEQEFIGDDRVDPEQVARAVFSVLVMHVSEGEIEDIKHILPTQIRDFLTGDSASAAIRR